MAKDDKPVIIIKKGGTEAITRRLEDRLRGLRNGDDVFLSLYVVDQYCLHYNAPVHCLVL